MKDLFFCKSNTADAGMCLSKWFSAGIKAPCPESVVKCGAYGNCISCVYADKTVVCQSCTRMQGDDSRSV